ncbi:MAG: glycosyltransferase [Caldisericota bacterium]|nr:glycosyltransferase [Caldisericota bacterium]
MSLVRMAAIAYVVAGAVWWIFNLTVVLLCRRKVRFVKDFDDSAPPQWPRVSLIIPARNEEDGIEAAVQTRLKDEYPDMEAILVDDRSTDTTGAIIDTLASKDPRVTPVHVTKLPPDWLGKQHAMQVGLERSTGEWVLFTDADVHVVPGCLRKAIAHSVANNLDVLAVIPELRSKTFLLDAVIAQFVRTIVIMIRGWDFENPRTRSGAGSGSFTLVRRTALDRSPGLQWLRLELGDDLALGQMLKASGAHCSLAMGRGTVDVLFYPTLRAMAQATERAGFTTIGHFSMAYIVPLIVLYGGLELSPYVALLFWRMPILQVAGVALLMVAQATCIMLTTWWGGGVLPAMAQPVGALMNGVLMLRAGLLGTFRGGVYWRGTFYPTSLLRKGRRVRF